MTHGQLLAILYHMTTVSPYASVIVARKDAHGILDGWSVAGTPEKCREYVERETLPGQVFAFNVA